ncbi:hypothetical protein RF11_04716 [Thelohanellus kitauei]|uniref:Uncharacterized protein n=1 Tax=Thelohanellus kitauei TaxID=669202 RepID=A0A0C2JE07_THEKT|nr:hypothetical protein RF11_04716 [Thelohanellus kitauei]
MIFVSGNNKEDYSYKLNCGKNQIYEDIIHSIQFNSTITSRITYLVYCDRVKYIGEHLINKLITCEGNPPESSSNKFLVSLKITVIIYDMNYAIQQKYIKDISINAIV